MTSLLAKETDVRHLDVASILNILGPEGPLALSIKGFESRDEQKRMMQNVLEAYNHDQIALIEAGTGTGKSLAYLIPAILWASQNKERTVISTNTINLQEQLLHKDIPALAKALKIDIKPVLVKGMYNYLCLRKFSEAQQEFLLLSPQEAEELQKIDIWKENTADGSRSSLPFSPSAATWDKVAAESDTCNRNKCPFFQQCHFFKARRQANDAQLLIANHHLLFADVTRRAETENYKDPAILPPFTRLILDEAHNIEDIATDYFASRISQMDIMRLMGRLTADKGGKVQGKLPLLKEKLVGHYRNNLSHETSSIHHRLTIDLPGLRREIQDQTHKTFNAFHEFVQRQRHTPSDESGQPGENKLRILPSHQTHALWNELLLPHSTELSKSLKRFAQALTALSKDFKDLRNTALEEQVQGILFEVEALAKRLEGFSIIIDNFFSQFPPTKVRWMEIQALKTLINTTLVDADLDIAKTLAEFLFSKFSTIILCSATLTTAQNFSFIRNRLGLTEQHLKYKTINENIYQSPFDYKKQALLIVPNDLPPPTDSRFLNAAAENIWLTLQASRGNAFVLFTSYTMLKQCYEMLETRLKEQRFYPLKQGDDERQTLLQKFKTVDRSVLFGTDSFWEGVDVAGEALRCVIIVKLPFKVPSEPIIQARSEAITTRGGDPFMEYSLPQAIVKFKQGFGRLIRNRQDRGCIVCLDNRLITKRYGKEFLNSLPDCQKAFIPSAGMPELMADFYRRTHFLTKKS